MGIKTYNPYTPSRRQMTGSDFSEITKTTPEKSLLDSGRCIWVISFDSHYCLSFRLL